MAKRSIDGTSNSSNTRGRPGGWNPLQNRPLPETNPGNSFRLLSADLKNVILKHLLPASAHLDRPYDLVSITEPAYLPAMKALAAFGRTCKQNRAVVEEFRRRDDTYEFRQFGSAVEYAYKLKRDEAGGAAAIDAVYQECLDRYGVDPVTDVLSSIPLRAEVHVFLDLEQDDVLAAPQQHIDKQWKPGRTHAVKVSTVWDEASCKALVNLLNAKYIEVEELQIARIESGFPLAELARAIGRCLSLKHVSISNATQAIVTDLCKLSNVVSLKLDSIQVEQLAETLANAKFASKLECLSISGTEQFSLHELKAFAACAGRFIALKDIRLFPHKLLEPETTNPLVGGLKNSPLLNKICLRMLPEQAALSIVRALRQSDHRIRHLEFVEVETKEAECGKLIEELIGLNSMQVLVLHSVVDADGVGQLNAMLKHPSCALQNLELFDVDLRGERGILFAEVLLKNPSLESLSIHRLKIDEESAAAIGRAIAGNERLWSISLGMGEEVSQDASFAVAIGALGSSSLVDLQIDSDNWPFDEEPKFLSALQQNSSILNLALPVFVPKSQVRTEIEAEISRRLTENSHESALKDGSPRDDHETGE